MGLNDLAKKIHENAKGKGFWDNEREIGTLLMLVVSELGEALEADRKDNYADLINLEVLNQFSDDFPECFETAVKDIFEDELADTIIRILDICGKCEIDIEKHIELKMKYNETRPLKHGKRY
jgi:NTP pyrophosphatase (non-canonical NTP hydrolase)